MLKIYFVRHGETDWNIEKRMQGQVDIPLNEFGCTLAVKTGIGMKDIQFDYIYASPLSRAYHTAELIMQENKRTKTYRIQSEERIKEISFGIYEGLCCSKEGWNMPDDNFKNFFQNSHLYVTPEGGESLESVMCRTTNFLNEIFRNEDLKDKTILVVSHGATIRGMINYITNNPVAQYWAKGVHKNCGVTIVNYDGEKPVIEVENMVYYDDEVQVW
ncbi:MAG: histidine phosphatase family protein [Eubacteriales bacterium]